MEKYNFYLSYCISDGLEYAQKINKLLTEKGYTVLLVMKTFIGVNFLEAISEAIKKCDCFLPIITEKYTSSEFAQKELYYALNCSKNRAKKIVPLVVTEEVTFDIAPYQWIKINTPQDITIAVEWIERIYGNDLKASVLYEKLVRYKAIKNNDKIAITLCNLIDLTLQKWENSSKSDFKETQNICNELNRLYTEMEGYIGRYDEESRTIAHRIIDTLDKVEKLLNTSSNHFSDDSLFRRNIYFASSAIRILYSDRKIRQECADILTNGDVHNTCPIEWCISRQAPFVKAYTNLLEKTKKDSDFSREDISFIEKTKEFIFENITTEEDSSVLQKTKHENVLTENDEILLSVAKFMQEGNRLFDILQSRGIAGDFLNCLLTSYERLKNYCEVVGAIDVAADCVDRMIEIRNAIEYKSKDNTSNEKVENGIKSLLGFTLRASGNYDVFISFKNEDSDLAERIYDFCQQNLKVPFWSKRTLPQLSKSEYEDAIYDAIRKSKHFVVVLSNLQYLNTNWIKREMAAFDRAITEGRKQNANFVFVVTDDVYREIINSNKMCLDERYCGYQIIKMSEYEETLMSYVV